MKWISVKKQLPKHLQEILVKTSCKDCPYGICAFAFGHIGICSTIMLCEKHFNEKTKKKHIRWKERITHWKPLPEAKK